MRIIVGGMAIIIGTIMVYFSVPYSPVKTEYKKLCNDLVARGKMDNVLITESDINSLPKSIKYYIINNGYIGTQRNKSMRIDFEGADFILKKGDSPIKINYSQINTAYEPNRVALIDTSMYGIPFQGIDAFVDGTGSMKGVLGKSFTLFDQGGRNFIVSSMLTYLAESVLMPSVFLEKNFNWKEIDEYNVMVTLDYYNESVTGVFSFDSSWQVISFQTEERILIEPDGQTSQNPWEVKYLNYQKSPVINRPLRIQAIWHYEDESSVYFDGAIENIIYD